jgi:hypothetical protein
MNLLMKSECVCLSIRSKTIKSLVKLLLYTKNMNLQCCSRMCVLLVGGTCYVTHQCEV